ncbi:glycosyltransferase [Paracoccus sp. S-4012]|uniref:glycosyltransferase n=1 Tax=Paracoccus sp. S-4012 TaxID=2665648 RepID=UPI0012AF109B|nr:glycosyltransferase [Paracoccus sp. S-4012]MRX50724.1 glycosyltransferase [Paracoccus sp. S-4012]
MTEHAVAQAGREGAARVAAVVISWDGMHEAAASIAEGLAGHVDELFVVYSNATDRNEVGPGAWHRVAQSWFYGRKFEVALRLAPTDSVLLAISADAAAEDWGDIVAGLREALRADPAIAVWAPDLDATPWPSHLVADADADADADAEAPGALDEDGLLDVLQTDGVVWAVTPPVAARLRRLDYGANNLGWGIDWTAIACARLGGGRVVRDLKRRIRHAEGRGYSTAAATQNFKNLLGQLSEEERRWVLAAHERVSGRAPAPARGPGLAEAPAVFAQARTVLAHPAQEAAREHPLDAVKAVHLLDGRAWVLAARSLEGEDVALEAGGRRLPLRPVAAPPPLSGVAQPYPMRDADGGSASCRLNGHGGWQVAAWNTLCVTIAEREAPLRLALGPPLAIAGAGRGARFSARLAAHRAAGDLVLRLRDGGGGLLDEIVTAFDPRCLGADRPEGYQAVSLALPDEAQTVELLLDYRRAASPAGDPPVFFVAEPQIVPARPRESHYRAEAVHYGTTDTPHWHAAEMLLSDAEAAQGVALVSLAARRPVADLAASGITLQRDWGHVLELNAARAFHGVLLRDGQPVCPVHLAAGHNVLRLPEAFLTGTTTAVEIRDASGIHVAWRDWLLPPRQLTALPHLQAEGRAPLPVELFPQTAFRYRALRAHARGGSSPALMAQLDTAIARLEAGMDHVRLGPLAFPKVEAPDVTVVIPAHNQIGATFCCLNALLLAWNRASFEVIVVDDASTDATRELEAHVTGIRVIRHDSAQRFIRACNAGVAAARGRYVALLNNDTEPTTGWLDELIEAMEARPDAGLVGSKLLWPDGRLQEAGGIVWGNGDPWNYGRGANPWEPRFCYTRQADYLSGAALLTTRALWDEVGGLSDYLEPMYFEDTDLAFKIRAAGRTTWFVPSSVVFHHEGVTSGTDTAGSGFKRFQEVNRPKFKRQWLRDYAAHAPYGEAPDLEKDRGIHGRILFVDYTTPTPDRDAGSYAALMEIELMQSLGFKVTLLPENLAWLGGYSENLQKMGVEVITAPFFASIDQFLEARAAEFDAFYVMRYHVVNNVVPKIRALNPEARIVMNGADLHYLRLLRRGKAAGDADQIAAAREVRVAEIDAMRSVDVVVSYNEVEAAVIEAVSEGEVAALPCPWVLDFPEVVPPRIGRAGLSFLGSFHHHPNVEGLQWFVERVMGPLAEAAPDLVLSVYGSRMNDAIRAMASPVIRPLGYVEDVAQAYDPHLLFVAPLISGAGIKGKVLNALARGVPCVLSPVAAEGIGLRSGHDCMVAETPEEWVAAITGLTADPARWTAIRDNAMAHARARYGFETARAQMRRVFEAVDLYGRA